MTYQTDINGFEGNRVPFHQVIHSHKSRPATRFFESEAGATVPITLAHEICCQGLERKSPGERGPIQGISGGDLNSAVSNS